MLDRAAQGHPVVPQAGRPARPGRRVVARTSRRTASAMEDLADALFAEDDARAARPMVTLVDFDPDGRGQARRRHALPATPTCPRTRCGRGCGACLSTRSGRVDAGLRGRAHQPPPQAGAGARAHVATASTCCPTTARSATSSATACSPSSGRRWRRRHGYVLPEAVDEAGLADRFDGGDGPARPTLHDALADRVPGAGGLRRGAGLPGALRRCSSTPARRCTCSSCAPARRATPSTAGCARRCTASSPSRPATALVAELMRFVDHGAYDLERLEAERRAESRRLSQ